MLESIKYLIGSAGASGFSSKSTAEQVTDHDLGSITAVITGATSGIGAETARVLAKRGARLVLPARNVKAAEDIKARIVSEFPDSDIIVMGLDLSSLHSVTRFVQHFLSLGLPLNLLINKLIFNRSLFVNKATARENDMDGENQRRARKNSERVFKYSHLVFRRYDSLSCLNYQQ
ncbi:hypothetical protein RD792_009233 [Penstemon davidsonii]|uniref:Uncharacterized protein n=1 Tax=Penstemon davidsonii TaxID=160366 RepID=A0ABR0DCU9_9LAMI|nr:hypothetical protein RD792_009233 [Penstemon davidsonii]